MTPAGSDTNRILSAATFGAIGLWMMFALTSWHGLANGLRFGLPWDTYAGDQTLLFDRGVQLVPVLGCILLNMAAGLIGYRSVIAPIWGHRYLANPIWLGFAGIIPGSLLVIALSRIVTLLLPNTLAPTVLLCAILAGALCALYTMRSDFPPKSPLSTLALAFLQGSAVLLVVLIFFVQVDIVHVANEGSVWFINSVFLSDVHGIGTGGQWPLFSQHYDEAAFLYPIVYGTVAPGPEAAGTLTVIYWIMLAFGRVAIASLVYLAIRALGVDRLSSLILTMFVMGASLSLNPVASRLLFDSLSPLGYVSHISRVLVPVLPLVFIAMAAERVGHPGVAAFSVATVLGVGLSSMAIHALTVLIWAAAVAVLTEMAPRASSLRHVWQAACVSCLLIIAAFTISYGIGGLPAAVKVGLLVGATIVAAATMGWTLLSYRRRLPPQRPELAWLLLLLSGCFGYALGLAFLGNAPIDFTYASLSSLWPWSRVDLVERFYSTLASSSLSLVQSPYCESGYEWMYRSLTGHCGSLAMFVRTYGLGFVAITFVIAWWLHGLPRSYSLTDRSLTMVMNGLVLCLLAMTIGFVLFDFVSPVNASVEWQRSLSIWLRSRLIEPWFYGGIFLAFALYFGQCTPRERHWVQAIMLIAFSIHTLSPMLFPAQFMANFAFLLGQMIGGG